MQTIINFDCQQIYKFLYISSLEKVSNMEKIRIHLVFLESHSQRRYASGDLCIYEYLSLISSVGCG